MDGNDAAAWLSAGAATIGAVAAIAAWRAAGASAKASRDLKAIEAARRHQELTPQLSWRIRPSNPGSGVFSLLLELGGPIALERLNRLTVKIRDDRPGRDQEPLSFDGNGLTADQIRRQVWGPLRFTPGVGPGSDRADLDGRTVAVTKPLNVGEGLQFQLERTKNPWHWRTDAGVADEEWQAMVGPGLRLAVTAYAEESDAEPWTLPYEVEHHDTSLGGHHDG